MKRVAAWLCYHRHLVCFACGKVGDRPCREHTYGGVIYQWRLRRLVPWWIACHIDCRHNRPVDW